jgi:hypothetical protein
MTAVATTQQHTLTSSYGWAVYHSDSLVQDEKAAHRRAGTADPPPPRPAVDARASFQQQFARHHAMSMRLVRPYCISIQYCIH